MNKERAIAALEKQRPLKIGTATDVIRDSTLERAIRRLRALPDEPPAILAADEVRKREQRWTPVRLAEFFHDTYERLAPGWGWETNEASRVPFDALPESNRNLMVSVCSEVLIALAADEVETVEARPCSGCDSPLVRCYDYQRVEGKVACCPECDHRAAPTHEGEEK